jgi:ABC-type transport system substrate-binding protein
MQKSYQLSDNLRVTNLYDPVNDLAETFLPNKEATLWTLRIKDGVELHSGKTVTADDIAYTIRGWGDASVTPISRVECDAPGDRVKGVCERDRA